MKEKGLIIEVNDHNVILLTEDGQFISRRISGFGLCPQIGDEINIEEEKQKRLWFSVSVLVAAAVLVVALFAGKLWSASQVLFMESDVVSYVTVDINPSVELGLDQEKVVVTVRPLNRDGRMILQGLVLKGQTSEEAVDIFVDAAAKEGYLVPEKENQVIINVSEKISAESKDSQASQTISRKAEKTLAEQNLNVKIEVIHTDLELREKAEEIKLSAGKYAILVEAKEAGLNIDAESIKKFGVTKAIKDAGGDPAKIIKSAQEETDFSGKIVKWQQQIKDYKQLIKEEEKNNKIILQEIKKHWKENDKSEKTKGKPSEINDQRNNLKEQGKDKKDYVIFNKDRIMEEIEKYKDKDKDKDNNKDNNNRDDNNKDNNSKDKNNKDKNNRDNNRDNG